MLVLVPIQLGREEIAWFNFILFCLRRLPMFHTNTPIAKSMNSSGTIIFMLNSPKSVRAFSPGFFGS